MATATITLTDAPTDDDAHAVNVKCEFTPALKSAELHLDDNESVETPPSQQLAIIAIQSLQAAFDNSGVEVTG